MRSLIRRDINTVATRFHIPHDRHPQSVPQVLQIPLERGLGDLQRIISALENKIDISSFEALVRAVEMKPDRHELGHVLPSSYRGGGASGIEKEMDRSLQYELERRI